MYQCLKSKGCLLCGCALWTAASVFKAFPRLRIFALPPEINAGRDMLLQFCTETESDLMNNISLPCKWIPAVASSGRFLLALLAGDPTSAEGLLCPYQIYQTPKDWEVLLWELALAMFLSHGLLSEWITISILEISVNKMFYLSCPSVMKSINYLSFLKDRCGQFWKQLFFSL